MDDYIWMFEDNKDNNEIIITNLISGNVIMDFFLIDNPVHFHAFTFLIMWFHGQMYF